MKQRDIFLMGEGDEWFNRNKSKISWMKSSDIDFLVRNLEFLPNSGKKFLEIGCSSGLKSKKIQNQLQWEGFGIDPSTIAIRHAQRFNKNNFFVATADSLPFKNEFFDLCFFAFCLYLVDREDLEIVFRETVRVLKTNGFISILDFDYGRSYEQKYLHKDDVVSYKEDYSHYLNQFGFVLIAKESYSDSGEIKFETDPNLRVSITLYAKSDSSLDY